MKTGQTAIVFKPFARMSEKSRKPFPEVSFRLRHQNLLQKSPYKPLIWLDSQDFSYFRQFA